MLAPMVNPEIDVEAEFQALERALDAYDALRARLGEREHATAPAISGWSVAQHLFHIALASDLALRHVRSLLDGKGRLVTQEGELGARAAAVLVSERTQRGVAQAPRMVTPGAEVNPEFLTNELRGAREGVAALRTRAGEIPVAQGWISHQELGTLNAAHWLRFARLHAHHHLAIAEEIALALESTAPR
jgi:hypothetical protein